MAWAAGGSPGLTRLSRNDRDCRDPEVPEENRAPPREPTMPYERPQPARRPVRSTRGQRLDEYFAHYRELAARDPDALNRKIPRDAFAPLLERIGELLVTEAARAAEAGVVREFLDGNPVPPPFEGELPDDFRAFCLALNALKQWVSAEQAATDRYLLGSTARADCRAAADACILSGEALDREGTELHHPVRDGRPPVPLSKAAHSRVEGQTTRSARPRPTRNAATDASPRLPASPALAANRYPASRLVFKAGVIDRLELHQAFQIETPEGTFEMTRAEFLETFANVAASPTYATVGVYSYSRTPAKALRFLLAPIPAEGR